MLGVKALELSKTGVTDSLGWAAPRSYFENLSTSGPAPGRAMPLRRKGQAIGNWG